MNFHPPLAPPNHHLVSFCRIVVPDVLRLHRGPTVCSVSCISFSYWMSPKSRSLTPTPNISSPSSPNITSNPESTTLRPHTHENVPARPTAERAPHSPSRPTHLHSFQFIPDSSAASSSRRRPSHSPPHQSMAKRLRRESPKIQGQNPRSSPSSDSQDGMADTEMETARGQISETLPPTTAPQKKKRTRTLTTPHQSAVLHALLAQSRFPTTAMREEVGQRIGLSARKVQIWFQNQRQKARRPRSQSDASVSRPPQYGPFPSGPDSAPSSSFAVEHSSVGSHPFQHSGPGFEDRRFDQAGSSGYPPPSRYSVPLESSSRLLGPGMPGSDLHMYREGPRIAADFGAPPSTPFFANRPYLEQRNSHPGTPQSMHPIHLPRPASSARDFSRTLPPLDFGSTHGQGISSGPESRGILSSFTRSPMPMTSFNAPRSLSPEPTFAHYPLESSAHQTMAIPPPFTLQPQPQWESSLFPSARPGSSAWSRPGSRSMQESPLSPASLRRDSARVQGEEEEATPRPASAPRPRSSRYDPVRAAFIPYTPAGQSPSAASPTGAHSDNENNHEHP